MLPRGGFWLRVKLASPVPELPGPSWPRVRDRALSVLEVLRILERAASDPRVAGLVLRLEGTPGGFARIASLRRATAAVRAAGKPVLAWSESYRGLDLWLASAADRVLLPPSGAVEWTGLHFEGFYWKGLLTQLGIRPQVLRAGRFKSAGETLTRESMSSEQREQQEALLEDVWGALVSDVAVGRNLTPDHVRALADQGPYVASAAREAGLVDECLYPDELADLLLELAPGLARHDGQPSVVDARAYAGLGALDAGWLPLHREPPHLAYVIARGPIGRSRSPRALGSEPYRQLFRRLEEDEAVRGVVLRIDSPGGEVVSSDLLGRAVVRLAARKPVVVSMGDTAASGGYLMAAGAQAILAEAGTLTGSIGVVGGKLDLSSLYERLGVRKDGVSRGARAGLLSEARAFTQDEERALRSGIRSLYSLFVKRVAEGRGMAAADVDRAGRGRVWSGGRALGLGLVDALGGPLEALAVLRRRAGIADAEQVVVEVLPQRPRLPSLRDWLPLGLTR